MNYEYQWVVTFEAIAETEEEAEQKVKDFNKEIMVKYAMSDNIWVTRIEQR